LPRAYTGHISNNIIMLMIKETAIIHSSVELCSGLIQCMAYPNVGILTLITDIINKKYRQLDIAFI